MLTQNLRFVDFGLSFIKRVGKNTINGEYKIKEMMIRNLLDEVKANNPEPEPYDFLGNIFQLDISGELINTFEQRVTLIDKATQIEHDRLINDEDSWAIEGLNMLGENWIEVGFDDANELLLNLLRFDLAYRNSERLTYESAKKLHDLMMFGYAKDDSYFYVNYEGNPWQGNGHCSGWPLTYDWTLDYAVVIINQHKLTFSYFLSED